MIFNDIIKKLTGNSSGEEFEDLSQEVQRIILDERNKYIKDIAKGKIKSLKSRDIQKRCINRLKKSGIKVDEYKTFKDEQGYYIVPIVCHKDGQEYPVLLTDKFKNMDKIKKIMNRSKASGFKKALVTIGLVSGTIVVCKLFGDKVVDLIELSPFGIESDDNTYNFNNNEEKEFIYDMIYRLEEKQPVDANGNPKVDIIEVKNDYAHYEVWNPGHLTGKGLKQGDLRDITEEQVETLHSTAAGMKRAENIGRDFPNGVSTTGMFDVGRNSNGEEDVNALPRYLAYESLFEVVKHNGTEIVAYGGGKECVEKTSDEILNMLIDFTAITDALTNSTTNVCHGDIYNLPSRIRPGTKVVRYADAHSDPINLMSDSELKQKVIDEISKRTEYYKSIGVNYDDYIKYARNRKTKETQSKISSDDEKIYSNLSEQEKQNIAKAYQYFKNECDMDEIGVSGIVGVILATSKGNPTYTGNNGYGIFAVNKANLQNWAKQNGKNIEDIETQLEYYYKVILNNTVYSLGTDKNDNNYYNYPVKYGNLKFICAEDAANWNLLYALEQDSSDYAKKMAELIYKHRKELEERKITLLPVEYYEIGYENSYIKDWKESIKIDFDEQKAIKACKEGNKEAKIDFEIVS